MILTEINNLVIYEEIIENYINIILSYVFKVIVFMEYSWYLITYLYLLEVRRCECWQIIACNIDSDTYYHVWYNN